MLRCVRGDGSVTWQKQDRQGAFFAVHDLTHFAVESTRGFRRGFFGLLAEGWDIEDTSGKRERGGLPMETVHVESIAGLLDAERASGEMWPTEDFNRQLAMHFESTGLPLQRELSEEELSRVRARRDELFAAWSAIEAGQTLDLTFYVQNASPML